MRFGKALLEGPLAPHCAAGYSVVPRLQSRWQTLLGWALLPSWGVMFPQEQVEGSVGTGGKAQLSVVAEPGTGTLETKRLKGSKLSVLA